VRRFIAASLALGWLSCLFSTGCGGPDCDPPEYGSCTRDFEHHGARELSEMAWMVGRWRATDGDERVYDQRWSPAIGGIMLGFAQTHHAERDLGSMFLRIEVRRDRITYTTHPEAQMPGVPFALSRERRHRDDLVFESSAHDFPTRIIYRHDGDDMVVRIENDEMGFTRTYVRTDEEESDG
jgi:hypothetical protein